MIEKPSKRKKELSFLLLPLSVSQINFLQIIYDIRHLCAHVNFFQTLSYVHMMSI